MMQEIGGFFELELHCGEEYHAAAIKVNSGSDALKYNWIEGEDGGRLYHSPRV